MAYVNFENDLADELATQRAVLAARKRTTAAAERRLQRAKRGQGNVHSARAWLALAKGIQDDVQDVVDRLTLLATQQPTYVTGPPKGSALLAHRQ